MTRIKIRGIEWSIDDTMPPSLLVLSGADAYGWITEESDLDLRSVWIPGLRQALSIFSPGRTKQSQIGQVDYTSYPIRSFLQLLVRGNGNCLENLFQKRLYCKDPELWDEIQEVTIDNLTTKFLYHYLGYRQTLVKDMNIPSRLKKYGLEKLLLQQYRVLQAGLILAQERMVIYNLKDQENFLNSNARILRSIYIEGRKLGCMGKSTIMAELDELEEKLSREIKRHERLWAKTNDNTKAFMVEFPTTIFDKILYEYYTIGTLYEEG